MTVIRERFGLADTVIVTAVAVLSASILYPFWNIFSVSISSPEAIARGDVMLFPIDPRFDVYSAVLSNPRIYRAYFNTILYTVTSAVLTLSIGSITAYPLSLAGFQGRKYVTILLVVSLFVMPGLIPTYLLIISLGLRDTMWSFVLPAAINVWYIVIIRTNFQTIPDALLESARLDGANDLTVLSRIVLPVSKAILATIGMFAAVHMWGTVLRADAVPRGREEAAAVDRAAQRAGQGTRWACCSGRTEASGSSSTAIGWATLRCAA